VQADAEAAGDWTLTSHFNQGMPYCQELPWPAAATCSLPQNQVWGFLASQEFDQLSPAMYEEFMFDYQLPIMDRFGLVSYGCCENLTDKISILRQSKSLRRIAVTPWADLEKCAERIGTDYVYSWRPNPALMVCTDWDPDRIRSIIRQGLAATRGCFVDIVLKDVQTLQGEPERLARWVQLVRDVMEEVL